MGKGLITQRALKVSMRTHPLLSRGAVAFSGSGPVWDSGSPPGTGGVARSAGVV